MTILTILYYRTLKMYFLHAVAMLLLVSLALVVYATPLIGFGRGRGRFRPFGVGTREYPDPYAFVRPEFSRAFPVYPNFITGIGR